MTDEERLDPAARGRDSGILCVARQLEVDCQSHGVLPSFRRAGSRERLFQLWVRVAPAASEDRREALVLRCRVAALELVESWDASHGQLDGYRSLTLARCSDVRGLCAPRPFALRAACCSAGACAAGGATGAACWWGCFGLSSEAQDLY